jgi:hypothetical protein
VVFYEFDAAGIVRFKVICLIDKVSCDSRYFCADKLCANKARKISRLWMQETRHGLPMGGWLCIVEWV